MKRKIFTIILIVCLSISILGNIGQKETINRLDNKITVLENEKKDLSKQHKEYEEKTAEENKKLKLEIKDLEQDKEIAELELEKEIEEDVWYKCEKCGITNGDVEIHNGFYMCPDCIEKENSNNNSTSNNSSSPNYVHKNNSNSSFNDLDDDNTTYKPSKGYVYWTPSGKSYHSRKSCPTLKRSKTIYEGYNCPKTDPCNICVKNRSISNNYSNYNDNEDSVSIPDNPPIIQDEPNPEFETEPTEP